MVNKRTKKRIKRSKNKRGGDGYISSTESDRVRKYEATLNSGDLLINQTIIDNLNAQKALDEIAKKKEDAAKQNADAAKQNADPAKQKEDDTQKATAASSPVIATAASSLVIATADEAKPAKMRSEEEIAEAIRINPSDAINSLTADERAFWSDPKRVENAYMKKIQTKNTDIKSQCKEYRLDYVQQVSNLKKIKTDCCPNSDSLFGYQDQEFCSKVDARIRYNKGIGFYDAEGIEEMKQRKIAIDAENAKNKTLSEEAKGNTEEFKKKFAKEIAYLNWRYTPMTANTKIPLKEDIHILDLSKINVEPSSSKTGDRYIVIQSDTVKDNKNGTVKVTYTSGKKPDFFPYELIWLPKSGYSKFFYRPPRSGGRRRTKRITKKRITKKRNIRNQKRIKSRKH